MADNSAIISKRSIDIPEGPVLPSPCTSVAQLTPRRIDPRMLGEFGVIIVCSG
jgi:hypothetical protein